MKILIRKFVAALAVAGALGTSAAAAPADATAGPDPKDNVIVECVTLAAALNSQLQNPGAASIPQNPLGPLACWPQDHAPLP